MSKRVSIWFLPVSGLVIILMLIPAACSGGIYADPAHYVTDSRSLQQKIEVPSLEIHAKRHASPGGAEAVYEVTAEYTFHNPGPACDVRFNLPAGYLKQDNMATGITEVYEDDRPVNLINGQTGSGSDLNLSSQSDCWQTGFKEDGVKNIRFKSSLAPEEKYIDGTIDTGSGLVVTRAEKVFFATLEEITLPIKSDIDWVDWTGIIGVEIDLGEDIPEAMITAYPGNYEFDGRKLQWRLDAPTSTGEVTAGIMTVADCLYRMDDAREVARALSDDSYVGYLNNLTDMQRAWYLRVARNGIFAKHGFEFSKNLGEYFESLAWYKVNPNYVDNLLTDEDRDMIRLLMEAEQKTR